MNRQRWWLLSVERLRSTQICQLKPGLQSAIRWWGHPQKNMQQVLMERFCFKWHRTQQQHLKTSSFKLTYDTKHQSHQYYSCSDLVFSVYVRYINRPRTSCSGGFPWIWKLKGHTSTWGCWLVLKWRENWWRRDCHRCPNACSELLAWLPSLTSKETKPAFGDLFPWNYLKQ